MDRLQSLQKFRQKQDKIAPKRMATRPGKTETTRTPPKRSKSRSTTISATKTNPNLPDLQPSLLPGLEVVFIGFNPGVQSSLQQHHYAHFTNLFWKLFNELKLLEAVLSQRPDIDGATDSFLRQILGSTRPQHDFELCKYGIGFTDLVLRCTKAASELSTSEKLENVPRLLGEFSTNRPKSIVFVGKGIWEVVVQYCSGQLGIKFKLTKTNFDWGLQNPEDTFYETVLHKFKQMCGYEPHIYVFPNTSGLVASMKYPEKLQLWQDLARYIQYGGEK